MTKYNDDYIQMGTSNGHIKRPLANVLDRLIHNRIKSVLVIMVVYYAFRTLYYYYNIIINQPYIIHCTAFK